MEKALSPMLLVFDLSGTVTVQWYSDVFVDPCPSLTNVRLTTHTHTCGVTLVGAEVEWTGHHLGLLIPGCPVGRMCPYTTSYSPVSTSQSAVPDEMHWGVLYVT